MINYRDPEWLTRAKELSGMETGALAKACGVSRSQLQRIANGDDPRLGTFIKIEDAVLRAVASQAGTRS